MAVSHSARLGEAALELALQMVAGGAPVRVAAGAGIDGQGAPILGTDAVAVAAAIDELATDCAGVLVLMDLGSAVLSAELALELRASDVPVRLTSAPFVEGLLAAVVSAAAGGSLDTVADEARAALTAKTAQVADDAAEPEEPIEPPARGEAETRRVRVRNPLGIHARPAALIADTAAGVDVRLRRLPDGPEAAAASLSRLLVLGARQGDELELLATDAGAAVVLDRLEALFRDGFGEGTDDAAAVTDDPAGAGAAPAADASEPAPVAAEPAPVAADRVPVAAEPAPVAADRVPVAADPVPVAAGTVLRGRGVSAGRAVAPVAHLAPPLAEPDLRTVIAPADRESEADAVASAAQRAADRLRGRAERASGETRAILEATRLLAADPELVAGAAALVRAQGRSAARAVWEAAAAQEADLAALGGRTAERAADLRDVRNRIIAEIVGVDMPGVPELDEPFVLVAADLAPADAATLAGGRCAGLLTEQGGPTSHTAIIARSLGLPAVVGVAGATRVPDGAVVLLDGETGTVEVEPPAPRIAEAAMRIAKAAVAPLAFGGTGALADGHRIALLANVGGAADAVAAASARAEGVGLFRTEFCFLDRATPPVVDEQVAAYRGVLAAFPDRRVVVRTLDAGSDKPLPFANDDDEENPALGVRGLRVARRSPQLLDNQLRALALAADAESARVEVMAPMVATVDEARDFAQRCRSAGLTRVGVMIETPAAAVMASALFEVVDFVSIGTNDLTQYTMAADRLHGELGDLNDPWQPAVLRLIAGVGEAGRTAGKPVGVCGEAAGDPSLAPLLIGLGATSLSMTHRALGRVADALARVDSTDCRRAADAVLGAATADEAREAAAAAVAG
ncbi:phosphoenolpyruvate--protein phosphotransferase [Microbacterium sp. 179-I 3D2 NHS]|uniref:phosphoenolpyruvate--protein phosphotransferase n=1 Tax=Microbacterium sp. 179-I 3D2 NHS TaxID=3235178 RepID=UPI0039A08DA1